MLPDDKLPSVRELATGLAINPNTIQRAYRELESEGFIYSVAGKGSFVAEDALKSGQSARKNEVLSQFDEIVEELFLLSVDEETIVERVRSDYAGFSEGSQPQAMTGTDNNLGQNGANESKGEDSYDRSK